MEHLYMKRILVPHENWATVRIHNKFKIGVYKLNKWKHINSCGLRWKTKMYLLPFLTKSSFAYTCQWTAWHNPHAVSYESVLLIHSFMLVYSPWNMGYSSQKLHGQSFEIAETLLLLYQQISYRGISSHLIFKKSGILPLTNEYYWLYSIHVVQYKFHSAMLPKALNQ